VTVMNPWRWAFTDLHDNSIRGILDETHVGLRY
jgi:hypothetical protein